MIIAGLVVSANMTAPGALDDGEHHLPSANATVSEFTDWSTVLCAPLPDHCLNLRSREPVPTRLVTLEDSLTIAILSEFDVRIDSTLSDHLRADLPKCTVESMVHDSGMALTVFASTVRIFPEKLLDFSDALISLPLNPPLLRLLDSLDVVHHFAPVLM